MRKLLYLGLLLAGIGLWAGCHSKKTVAATFSDLNGTWNVIEMDGKTVDPAVAHQFLVLNTPERTLSGSAGCNRIMGKIDYSDSQKQIIKFPGVATTRMACPDMTGENALLADLAKVVRFEARGERRPVHKIALYGIDNTRLLVLEKQK